MATKRCRRCLIRQRTVPSPISLNLVMMGSPGPYQSAEGPEELGNSLSLSNPLMSRLKSAVV